MSKSIKDFKKGDKIVFNWNNEELEGRVVGNPYRWIDKNERYVECYIYEYGEEVPINLKHLEKVGE